MRRILIAALGLLGGLGALEARTILLKPGRDDTTRLQQALIDARPGDTVRLAAGTYRLTMGLSLDVDGVTVRGAGPGRTILDFSGQEGAGEGLLITSSRVWVTGLTVRDPRGDGIKSKGSDRVSFTDLEVVWSGGPKSTNGAYGVYPVESSNVLIDRVTVRGASDTGIYVGQSRHVVVRRSLAEYNVAGIEIENSQHADVHDNLVQHNTGGILVFDLPDLPVKDGHSTRVFRNRVLANDTPNFAPPGNIVAQVPVGTGIMVMANRRVEVVDNEVDGNASAAVMVIAYSRPFTDARYNPLPRDVVVRGNRLGRNGFAPAFPGGADVAAAVGGTLPPVVWDGVTRFRRGEALVAEPVRLWVDAPAMTLGLGEAGAAPQAARPGPLASPADPPPPDLAPVILPEDQPGGR